MNIAKLEKTRLIDSMRAVSKLTDKKMKLKQSILKKVLEILYTRKMQAWKLKEEDREDWITTLDLRIRGVSYLVNENLKREKPPEWATNMVIETADGTGADSPFMADAQPLEDSPPVE